MIGRGMWFVAGAAAGVYGMVKARRVREAVTADGLRDRARAVALGARMVRTEIAQGQADAEIELRERYRTAAMKHPELEASAAAHARQSGSSSQSHPSIQSPEDPT